MALEDDIKKAETEEMQSQEMYGMMAMDAERMGQHDMARMIREVAGDESRHAQMMRSMHESMVSDQRRMTEETPDLSSSHFSGDRPAIEGADRPFPLTYSDWIDLADDIKAKMPQEEWGIVNSTLQLISEEHPNSEEAKRWFVRKAKELGISSAHKKLPDHTFKEGVYESWYGNAIEWRGGKAYDLDMGEEVPSDSVQFDKWIRELD